MDSYFRRKVEFAIELVLSNPHYLPGDPFKTIVHVIRRAECMTPVILQEKIFRRINFRIPSDIKDFTIVNFRSTICAGLSFVEKYVTESSLQFLIQILKTLAVGLGNLPATIEENGTLARYLTIGNIATCLSPLKLSTIYPAILKIMVEAILLSHNIDVSLNLFAKRILEEALQAETNPQFMGIQIIILMGDHVASKPQMFTAQDIRSKKKTIVSSIKGSVICGGSISLQFLWNLPTTSSLLPSLSLISDNAAGCKETSTSSLGGEVEGGQGNHHLIFVTREYHLSYIDDEGSTRCYQDHPFDTLARGIFLDLQDAILYKNTYAKHVTRELKSSSGSGGGGSSLSQPSKTMTETKSRFFDKYIQSICERSFQLLDVGDITTAVSELLQLQILLISKVPPLYAIELQTFTVDPIITLLGEFCHGNSLLGQIESFRLILKNMIHFINFLIHSLSLLTSRSSLNLTEERRIDMDREKEHDSRCRAQFRDRYFLLPAMLSEVKTYFHQLLQQIVTLGWSSELTLLQPLLLSVTCSLFDDIHGSHHSGRHSRSSVLPDDISFFSTNEDFKSLKYALNNLLTPMEFLDNSFKAIAASSGLDLLLEALQLELRNSNSDSEETETTATTTGLFMKGSGAKSKKKSCFEASQAPSTLTELLGYVTSQRSSGSKNSKESVGNWEPLQFDDITRFLLDNNNSIKSAILSSSLEQLPENYDKYLSRFECPVNISAPCWSKYTALNLSGMWRDGRVDIDQCELAELEVQDTPGCIARETVYLRYLTELQVTRALKSASYEMKRYHATKNHAAAFTIQLYSSSCLLHLWRRSDSEIMRDINRLNNARKAKVKLKVLFGASKLVIEEAVGVLKGGLVAHHTLLQRIGNFSSVYRDAWLLPPLIPSDITNSSTITSTFTSFGAAYGTELTGRGLDVQFACGLSAETAMKLGYPCSTSYQPIDPLEDNIPKEMVDDSLRPPPVDLGTGYPGKLILEFVVRINYSRSTTVSQIKLYFSSILLEIIQYLQQVHSGWLFLSAISDNNILTKESNYGTNQDKQRFIDSVCRTGEAVIDTAVLWPDDSPGTPSPTERNKGGNINTSNKRKSRSVPSYSKLIRILSSLVKYNTNKEMIQNTKESVTVAAVTESEGERQSIKQSRKESKRVSKSGIIGTTIALNDTVNKLVGNETEIGLERDPSSDASSREMARISCGDKGRGAASFQAELFNLLKVYIPCEIRVSLLAKPTFTATTAVHSDNLRDSWDESDIQLHLDMASEGGNTAEIFSIYRPTQLARLVASTVWVTSEASVLVWEGVSGGEEAINACVVFEASVRRQRGILHLQSGHYTEGYTQLGIWTSLLELDYLYPSIWRMYVSLAGRLSRVVDGITLLQMIIKTYFIKSESSAVKTLPVTGSSSSSSSIDYSVLSNTIINIIWKSMLELLVFDPMSIHLKGMLVFALDVMTKMMTLLGLHQFHTEIASNLYDNLERLAESTGGDLTLISMDTRLRISLGMPDIVIEVYKLLKQLETWMVLLVSLLGGDVHRNCVVISDFLNL